MYPTFFGSCSDEEESLVDVVEWDERVHVKRLLVTFIKYLYKSFIVQKLLSKLYIANVAILCGI